MLASVLSPYPPPTHLNHQHHPPPSPQPCVLVQAHCREKRNAAVAATFASSAFGPTHRPKPARAAAAAARAAAAAAATRAAGSATRAAAANARAAAAADRAATAAALASSAVGPTP